MLAQVPFMGAPYVALDDLRGGGIDAVMSGIRLDVASRRNEGVRLLAGGRGTGRSTELRRIARALARDDRMVVLLVELGRRGTWLRPPMAEELRAALARELCEAPWVGQGRHTLPQSRDLDAVLGMLCEQVAPRRLVLLVDDLDTMALPAWGVARGYQRLAEILLGQSGSFVLPGCMTVYVVSDHLVIAEPKMASIYDASVWFLPAVPIWRDREGSSIDEDAVERLVVTMEAWAVMEETPKPERSELMRRLVMLSGGNLGVLRRLAIGASTGAAGFEDAVARVWSRLESFKDEAGVLPRVHRAEGLHLVERAETGTVVEAMYHGALQTYWGGRGGNTFWQGVHPLIGGHARM